MALQQNHTINIFGKEVVFENAYHQITHLSGGKNQIQFQLQIFIDQNKIECINNNWYTFVPSVDGDSDNFIKQGYEHLKTLEKFKNSLDV